MVQNQFSSEDMFITDYLKAQVEKTPEAIAVSFNNDEISYEAFYRNVVRVAAFVQSKGMKKGDIVASMLLNSDLFMAVYYGVQLAGCTLLPINTKLAPDELTYIFNHSEAKGLIYDERLEGSLQQVDYGFEWTKTRDELRAELNIDRKLQPVENKANDTTLVLYTSGTTGRPKGVMLTHRNVISAVQQWSESIGYAKSDRVYISIPLFHCAGLHVIAVSTIYCGATLVIDEMFIPDRTIPTILEKYITVFSGVPTMYALLLSKFDFANQSFPNVRKMVYGSAPMPHEIIKNLKGAYPKVEFHNLYGQTESSPGATELSYEAVLTKVGSVGKALPKTELKIVDADGVELPVGEIGEICIKGEQIMKGYLKNDDETMQVIKNGWLYSGDLGRLDEDGYLYIVDRKKDLIIRGGENIYPIEVENVLYQLPQVIDAAVIGIPDPIYGEIPKAIVVLVEEDAVTEHEIMDYARSKLAKYKVPHVVEIVKEMPRNPSGKILKHVLRAREKEDIKS
ncbi:MAG: long-chain-fatty-acid--CoA ligase [Solibacillus sp.]